MAGSVFSILSSTQFCSFSEEYLQESACSSSQWGAARSGNSPLAAWLMTTSMWNKVLTTSGHYLILHLCLEMRREVQHLATVMTLNKIQLIWKTWTISQGNWLRFCVTILRPLHWAENWLWWEKMIKFSMGWMSLLAVTKLPRAAATSWRLAQYFSTDCYVVWRLLSMEGAPHSNLVHVAQVQNCNFSFELLS